MEGINPNFRTSFGFLLLILLQISAEAQDMCSAPIPVYIEENNPENVVLVNITLQPGVTVALDPPTNHLFKIEGNQLIATKALDYEAASTHTLRFICTNSTNNTLNLIIVVVVEDVNDNPPVFNPNSYRINVTEMSPVGTRVGRFPAIDKDKDGGSLYYTLTSESGLNAFKLSGVTNPVILVETLLDYDTVKNVSLLLTVQDTPLVPPSSTASFTATATIMVDILDFDNRPPWFQPCEKYEMGPAVICQGDGYTGRVNLNERETGVLPLKPGPIYAIDGDFGIDDEITYSFLDGDGGGLFQIDPNTGNITMLKDADLLGPISLTVLAAQKSNSFQFATTPVTVSVQVKSLHPPRLQFPLYEGVITGVGVMATDQKNKDEPLYILATDKDYAGGLNPYITYTVDGSSDFSIIQGRLFMKKDLPESTISLRVVATDMSTDEFAKAQLTVQVKSGGVSTDSPSLTTGGSVSTASTAHPATVIVPSGGYGSADMAAVGATLGVLLFICLVVIGLLLFRNHRGKQDGEHSTSGKEGDEDDKRGSKRLKGGLYDTDLDSCLGVDNPAGDSEAEREQTWKE